MAEEKDPKKQLEELLKAVHADKTVEQLEVAVTKQREFVKALQDAGAAQGAINDASERLKETQLAYADSLTTEQRVKEEILGLDIESRAAQKVRLALLREALDKLKQIRENTKETIKAFSGISDSWKNTFIGGLLDTEGGFEKVQEAIAETVTPMNILGSTAMKLQETFAAVTMEVHNAYPAFNAATGFAGEMDDVLTQATADARHLGLSFEDIGGVTQALAMQVGNFANVTDGARLGMIALSAEMGKLGVGAGESAEYINSMTNALGFSQAELRGVAMELAGTADAIDMPFSAMLQGFNAAMPRLAMFGQQAPRIFANVAAAAKTAGVEVNALLGVAAQYDTYEQAATSVGRLSMVLGHQVDAISLLRMEDDERILQVSKMMEMSGKSFATMDRFEKKLIAEAAGFQNVNDAAKFFGKTSEELQQQMGGGATSTKQWNKMLETSTSLGEKWSAVWKGAVEPIVTGMILPMMEGLGSMLDMINKLPSGMRLITVGFIALTSAMGAFLLKAVLIPGLADILIEKIFGEAPEAAEQGAPRIASAMTIISNGLVAFADPKVALGALVVTLAVIGMAFAFTLVMKALFPFFELLFEVAIAGVMPEFALGLLALAAASWILSYAGLAAVTGFAAMALGILSIAYALSKVDLEKIKSLADTFNAIKLTAAVDTTAFTKSVKEMINSVDDLNIEKVVKIKQLIQTAASHSARAAGGAAAARRTAGIGGVAAAAAAPGGNISVEIVVKDTSALGKAIAKSIKDSQARMLPGRYHR